MTQILFAVLLSAVAPGLGQLYNRDYRKAFLLIGLSFMFVVSLMIGLGPELAKALPAQSGPLDMRQARAFWEAAAQKNTSLFQTFEFLTMVTWIYGVVDAYLGARERLAPPPPAPDAE